MEERKTYVAKGTEKPLEYGEDVLCIERIKKDKEGNIVSKITEEILFTEAAIPYLLKNNYIEELPSKIGTSEIKDLILDIQAENIIQSLKEKYFIGSTGLKNIFLSQRLAFNNLVLKEIAYAIDNLYPKNIKDYYENKDTYIIYYDVFSAQYKTRLLNNLYSPKGNDPKVFALFRQKEEAQNAIEVLKRVVQLIKEKYKLK